MNKVIKLETNNIHIDIISRGKKASLARIKKEKSMWLVVDAVEEPYIFMRHKDITCIDAIFKFNKGGSIQLYSYTIDLNKLLKDSAEIKIVIGSKILDINYNNIVKALDNSKYIKRKAKDLDIFEIKHENEIMTIDCTQDSIMKLNIMEIN